MLPCHPVLQPLGCSPVLACGASGITGSAPTRCLAVDVILHKREVAL
jgi:hypothetical protein